MRGPQAHRLWARRPLMAFRARIIEYRLLLLPLDELWLDVSEGSQSIRRPEPPVFDQVGRQHATRPPLTCQAVDKDGLPLPHLGPDEFRASVQNCQVGDAVVRHRHVFYSEWEPLQVLCW